MTSAPIVDVTTPTLPVPKGAGRNVALDFTKGFLVLLMVVYHWFNYFVGQSQVYKYIRFLTPSFIFITGFIVSSIYFTRYDDVHSLRVPVRLATRALKIIAVFVALNAVTSAAVPSYAKLHPPMWRLFVIQFFGVAAPGVKDAAFTVLMPIGQLLLLSAILIFVYRRSHYVVHVFCALAFAAVFFLRRSGISNPNAELIAIGSLGMVLGMMPLSRLTKIINHPVLLAFAYALFYLAVSRWGEAYILQVVGVCLSVSVIYLIGASRWAATWLGEIVVLLGRYSLFGYISQIAILQMLHRITTTESVGAARLATSFVLAFVLTTCSVMLLSVARQRSGMVDRSYKFIFA